jgi:hypothetical protein
VQDVYRLHKVELDSITDDEQRCVRCRTPGRAPRDRRRARSFARLVELNVVESVYNVYKTGIIQRAWANGFHVQVSRGTCTALALRCWPLTAGRCTDGCATSARAS